jgi:hypothetical protein
MKILPILIASMVFLNCSSVKITKATQEKTRTTNGYLKKFDKVLISLPTVEESFEKKLTMMNWTGEKFCAELKDEFSYQLERRKVEIVSDSSQAKAFILIHKYDPGSITSPSKLEAYAILKTPGGNRRFEIQKGKKQQEMFETESQIIDSIRSMAISLASKMVTKPKQPKEEPVYEPQMWVIF